MKHIALITCSEFPDLTPSDQRLRESLAKNGFLCHAVAWDAEGIDWSLFDHIILRSCWNYPRYYEKFLAWLNHLSGMNASVTNPIALVTGNTHKTYLAAVEKAGIPVIPTVFLAKQSVPVLARLAEAQGWTDVVVKPAVGNMSRNVSLFRPRQLAAAQKKVEKLLKTGDYLLQPYRDEIIREGEYSFVFINNRFSHAVLKIPKKGNVFFDFSPGSREIPVTPSGTLVEGASRVLSQLGDIPLYARVDGINQNGTFVLMELELIEPHLFFDVYPPAADTFAAAFIRRTQ